VVEATNIPSEPVLGIHTDHVRRQANLTVNSPFVVPHPDVEISAMEVSLFQNLASHVLPEDATDMLCRIPVRTPDGTATQVRLRINGAPDSSASEASVEYLARHQLQNRIEELIRDVLTDQPEEPFKHMLKRLRLSRGEELKAPGATSSVSKVARPPAGPRDAKPPPHRRKVLRASSQESSSKSQDPVREAAQCAIALVLRAPACRRASQDAVEAAAAEEIGLTTLFARRHLYEQCEQLLSLRSRDLSLSRWAIRQLLSGINERFYASDAPAV